MNEIREIIPEFIDEEAIQMPPYKVYELSYGGKRLYYKYVDVNGEQRPVFAIGTTSLLSAVLPTPKELMAWKVRLGEKEADRVLKERSSYGTLMHTMYAKILINGEFDFDECVDVITEYLVKNELRADLLEEWEQELKKDILSFCQWMKDYSVKPLLMEGAMISDKYGFGGRVDFFGFLTISQKGFWGQTYLSGDKKGTPKETSEDQRILAIVDFKSGKNGFYESHEIQLECYKQLIAETFPETLLRIGLPVRIFNLAPSDWRDKPTYKFTDQSDKHSFDEIVNLFERYTFIGNFAGARMLNISGKVSLNRYESIAESFKFLSLNDIVAPKSEKKEDKPIGQQDFGNDPLFLDI